MLSFPIDQSDALLRQIERRDQQRIITGILRIRCKKTEDVVHRARNLRIRREQAEIGVDARGRGVVVAGPDMRVAAGHTIRVAPHQKRKFAVCLEADQSVKDLYPGVFEVSGPANIGCFVETRLQFHYRRNFLARCGVD